MKTRRPLSCPRCQAAEADTVTSAPYIRGFVLAYTFGTKRFVGCNSCVKKQLAGEVGLSLVAGWFSITSLLVNPMCILWNSMRLPFIKSDPAKVDALLTELGISTQNVDLAKVAASLAAAMVAADGKVETEEVDTAIEVGSQLVEGFTPELFIETLENVHQLPSPGILASLLADLLDEPGKVAVLRYLLAIAAADGHIDESEIEILPATATSIPEHLPEIPTGNLEGL